MFGLFKKTTKRKSSARKTTAKKSIRKDTTKKVLKNGTPYMKIKSGKRTTGVWVGKKGQKSSDAIMNKGTFYNSSSDLKPSYRKGNYIKIGSGKYYKRN